MFKKQTKAQWILEITSIIIMVGVIVYTAVKWRYIPEIIPMHFDISGMPDAYGGKFNVIVLVGIYIAVYGIMWLCQNHPSTWNIPIKITDKNRDRIYEIFKTYIIALKLIVTGSFAYILICVVNGKSLNRWFMPVTVIFTIGLIAVGIYVCKKG